MGPVKMLRQDRTKLLNTGYLFVLSAFFHQASNLSFSSGNANPKSVSYFCISNDYSPQPLDKKVSNMVSNLKGFHASRTIGVTVDLKHKRI